jgi:hypothetical protein
VAEVEPCDVLVEDAAEVVAHVDHVRARRRHLVGRLRAARQALAVLTRRRHELDGVAIDEQRLGREVDDLAGDDVAVDADEANLDALDGHFAHRGRGVDRRHRGLLRRRRAAAHADQANEGQSQ